MRKPWSWRKGLVILAITVTAFMALPVAHAQQVFVPGAVVALEGTPHLWIADAQGVLHWAGDTRALSGRQINWGARTEVSLEGLRALPKGDPWLSAGLLKQGDPIYLVKWETEWPLPRLLHIQSIADVELFGINGNNYGNFVLDVATWEARYGISVASLQRAPLPPAVPSAGTAPTAPTTPGTEAPADVPYQNIRGYGVGVGTFNLPQGEIKLQLEFGGWGDGPITVTYQTGGGAPVYLLNNQRVPFLSEIVFSVPQAASYNFRVSASRDWRIWVGIEPGLPSVPLPLEGCRSLVQWHQSEPGVRQARYDCGGDRVTGTSYDAINTDKKFWVVWYRNGGFLSVTSTGSAATATAGPEVTYQLVRGYNGGAGQFTLPKGQVTLQIVYDNWNAAPFSLTYRTPGGEHVRLIDSERISYRTNRAINVAQAGVYRIQVDAQRSWRVWVGEDVKEAAGGVPNKLKDIKSPGDCDLKKGTKWGPTGGVHRAEYECKAIQRDEFGDPVLDNNGDPIMVTTNTWRGAYYPGLDTATAFWVVWRDKNNVLRITSHGR